MGKKSSKKSSSKKSSIDTVKQSSKAGVNCIQSVMKAPELTFKRVFLMFITQIITVVILFLIEQFLFPHLGTTIIYNYVYKPLIGVLVVGIYGSILKLI
jgi:hypothetical protein